MEYLSLILSIVAVFIAIGYYLTKNRDIFKKHGIPHSPPQPILGNMGQLLFGKLNMLEVLDEAYHANSDAKYFGFFEFSSPVIVLRDPELIKSVTVKNFDSFHDHRLFIDRKLDLLFGNMLFSLSGEKWRKMRSVLSPTFTSSKIKGMFPLMAICAENFADYLSKLPEGNRDLELKNLFCKYTNDVIASCAFGASVDSINDPNNAFIVNGKAATSFTGVINGLKLMVIRNAATLTHLLGIRVLNKNTSKFFEDVVSSAVRTRDELGIQRPDMLQLLMEARNKKEAGKELTMDEITAHAFTFFFGGFDTVSTQLCFIFHELAANPEVQEKLQTEIDQALENTNGQLTYDTIHEMEYLDAVINEAMRMYASGPFLDRLCVKPFELPPALPGSKPFVVKPGMNIWFPIQSIQKDPKHFENPQQFDPERFITDGKRIMNSGTFIPFGIGPRMCIGNRFALTKIKALTCHVLARCDVKYCSKTSIPLEIKRGMFDILPKDGFWVKFEARKNPPPVVPTSVTNGTCKVGGDE